MFEEDSVITVFLSAIVLLQTRNSCQDTNSHCSRIISNAVV